MVARDENLDKAKYLLENFDRALEEEWFEVYYQPIIRTANGRVCDEEALVRWDDPIMGVLNPSEFLAILEAVNVVHKLDLYVLEHVLHKMTLQRDEGLFLVPISINISTIDFYSCDIVEEVNRRVEASSIPKNLIAIEIAESATAHNNERVLTQLEQFHNLGYKLWMDDFGGGDSSPILLQRIPFDLLKVNIGLINQIRYNETARIVITELIRMAISLGVPVAAEGVEDEDQVEFLEEIGCTKMQGFYFCRAVPMEKIFARYKQGKQIGFENPDETDYYVALGKISLYDLSFTKNDNGVEGDYFDTLPMAIVEVDDEHVNIIRSNKNLRVFLDKNFPAIKDSLKYSFEEGNRKPGYYCMNSIRQCGKDGIKRILDDRTSNGKTVQVLMQRVGVNDVKKVAAVAVAILSVSDILSKTDTLTYNYIARALSEDYVQLYFIDMDTDDFVQYNSDGLHRDVTVDSKGKDFFKQNAITAEQFVYKDDRELFLKACTKENIEQHINEHGFYSLTYRAILDDKPTYVNLKAVKVRADDKHIIIGISNVDSQIRQREALDRMKEERITIQRISALSGDFLAIYAVDPNTNQYTLYKTSAKYQTLDRDSVGADFFVDAYNNAKKHIYEEDRDGFLAIMNKDFIFKNIEHYGIFAFTYRLVIEGKPRYVTLKAALVEEKDGPQLLFGIIDVDEQIKKDIEYETNLLRAEKSATSDGLTGVKNKRAYVDLEETLNDQIRTNKADTEFAVVMMDLNGLKAVNDNQGHAAGDAFIVQGCKIICNAFAHSPVFRIGGDEFVVIARGKDYENMDMCIEAIENQNKKNKKNGKVTMAVGVSKYEIGDGFVSDVFERADTAMYERKNEMKRND